MINSNLNKNSAKKILFSLIFIELIFAAIFYFNISSGEPSWLINILFNFDGEHNIPAWFSSSQYLLIAILLLVLWQQKRLNPPPSSAFLLISGLLFIFLSMDEATDFHGKLAEMRHHFQWIPQAEEGRGIWISVYIFLGSVFILVTFRDLLALWKAYPKESMIVAIGATLLILGAAGMESIAYKILEGTTAQEALATDPIYRIELLIEELLEMIGCSLMLYGAMLFSIRKFEN